GVSPNGGGSANGILINEGTIQSEGDAIYLNAGSNRSTGILRAIDGARLVFERPVDNSNNTLRLEGEGTIALRNTIIGGTVIVAETAILKPSGGSTRLDGVVMDGDLSVNDADLFVMNGLTLNGELTVGGPEGQGRVWFDGTQTLAGNGTVILNAQANENVTGLLIRNDGDTLTIGENMTVRGRKGYLGVSPNGGGSTDSAIVNRGVVQLSFGAINSRFTNAGLFRVGGNDEAHIQINSEFLQESSGVLEIGLGPSGLHDRLTISSMATLNGTLKIVQSSQFSPSSGDEFLVLTFATLSGAFTEIIGNNQGSVTLNLDYRTNGLSLVAQ
ncbi:MAG TPA: hypothetical protein DDW52_25670, partial [Planctomycetaceae bacterium]|nr:hypothetical protein [Planctomycetaceae bacterium]